MTPSLHPASAPGPRTVAATSNGPSPGIPTHVLRGRVVPVSAPPIERGAVVVKEGRVSYIGAESGLPAMREAIEIEVGEGTIVPGLVDAHVHLASDGGRDFVAEMTGTEPDVLLAKSHGNALRALMSGIVAVRDLGAPDGVVIQLARAIRSGALLGPEIAAAGRPITSPGGHLAYLGLEVSGVEAMIAAATAELSHGADGLKLVATGGVLSPGVAIGTSPYDVGELSAATKVGLTAGRWIAAHAIGVEGTRRAVEAGATSIEHGVYLDADTVDLMVGKGVMLVSTRIALVRILENKSSIDADTVRKAEEAYETNIESARRAARAGVIIAAGSDAGTPFNPHGGLADEAALLVKDLDMSHELALRAVTVEAARCMKRDDLGHLSVGVPGHIAVLAGNPLDDISSLHHVTTVVAGGVLVDIEQLRSDLAPSGALPPTSVRLVDGQS